MYEASRELVLSGGTASGFPNNLSVFYHEAKNLTFAAIAHKYQVNTVNWDSKMEGFTSDQIPVKDSASDKPLTVLQVKFCLPTSRNFPLLVVASSGGAMVDHFMLMTNNFKVFDPRTAKLLAFIPLASIESRPYRFTRGITYVDNQIFVGSCTGELLVFNCSGENSINVKNPIKEHSAPIVDLATCRFDDLTCSCDVSGNIIVWSKNVKSAQKKINTEQSINCINVLRKQVICGTLIGQLLFYSTVNGQLMAEVNAHSRQVNAIAVAPESAYILTVGEDSQARVWKLHTRKPEAYQVEWRYSECIPNAAFVGAQFTNGRGSAFLLTAMDLAKLYLYKIAKKPSGVAP